MPRFEITATDVHPMSPFTPRLKGSVPNLINRADARPPVGPPLKGTHCVCGSV